MRLLILLSLTGGMAVATTCAQEALFDTQYQGPLSADQGASVAAPWPAQAFDWHQCPHGHLWADYCAEKTACPGAAHGCRAAARPWPQAGIACESSVSGDRCTCPDCVTRKPSLMPRFVGLLWPWRRGHAATAAEQGSVETGPLVPAPSLDAQHQEPSPIMFGTKRRNRSGVAGPVGDGERPLRDPGLPPRMPPSPDLPAPAAEPSFSNRDPAASGQSGHDPSVVELAPAIPRTNQDVPRGDAVPPDAGSTGPHAPSTDPLSPEIPRNAVPESKRGELKSSRRPERRTPAVARLRDYIKT